MENVMLLSKSSGTLNQMDRQTGRQTNLVFWVACNYKANVILSPSIFELMHSMLLCRTAVWKKKTVFHSQLLCLCIHFLYWSIFFLNVGGLDHFSPKMWDSNESLRKKCVWVRSLFFLMRVGRVNFLFKMRLGQVIFFCLWGWVEAF